MWIHYGWNGKHQSLSNSKSKSVNSYLRNIAVLEPVSIFNIQGLDITDKTKFFIDKSSLSTLTNLDCKNCKKLHDSKCPEGFPIEILINIDSQFSITKIILFCDSEETRLISSYGKHGHLRHCLKDDLLDSDFFKYSKHCYCDKNKFFKSEDYDYAYIECEKLITSALGKESYKEIYKIMKAYTDSFGKIGKLF